MVAYPDSLNIMNGHKPRRGMCCLNVDHSNAIAALSKQTDLIQGWRITLERRSNDREDFGVPSKIRIDGRRCRIDGDYYGYQRPTNSLTDFLAAANCSARVKPKRL